MAMKQIFGIGMWIAFGVGGSLNAWVSPEGFFENEQVTKKEIAPGVGYWEAHGEWEGKPMRTFLVVVDLAAGEYKLETKIAGQDESLPGKQFVKRSIVSRWMKNDPEAVAVINATFFDIKRTQSPTHLVVKDSVVLREIEGKRAHAIFGPEIGVRIGEVGWSGKIRTGKQSRPLTGINRPVLTGDQVGIYLYPWVKTLNTELEMAAREEITQYVGKVEALNPWEVQMRYLRKIEGFDTENTSLLKEDEMIVAATKSANPFFRNMQLEDLVVIESQLDLPDGIQQKEVTGVLTAGPQLVQDGESIVKVSGDKPPAVHPRSALGVDRSGKKVVLVLVDGRTEESAGMSFEALAKYFCHMGVDAALNLDGGGSSALGIREGKTTRIVNTPSDGLERKVPVALGVVRKN